MYVEIHVNHLSHVKHSCNLFNVPLSKIFFLICFPIDYRDFSVKSKVIISLFQTVILSLSIFTVCFVLFCFDCGLTSR